MQARTFLCTRPCIARLLFASAGWLLVFAQFVAGFCAVVASNHALQEIRPSESLAPVARPGAFPEQDILASDKNLLTISATPINAAMRVKKDETAIAASVSPFQQLPIEGVEAPPSGGNAERATFEEPANDIAVMPPSVDHGTSAHPVVSTSPSISEKAEAIEEVFVSLKEWKQKKLEDIESRVRKIKELGTENDPLRVHRMRPKARKRASRRSVNGTLTGVCHAPTLMFLWLSNIRQERCLADTVRGIDTYQFGVSVAVRPSVSATLPPDSADVKKDNVIAFDGDSVERHDEKEEFAPEDASLVAEVQRLEASTISRKDRVGPSTYANVSLPYGPANKAGAFQHLRLVGWENRKGDSLTSNDSFVSVLRGGRSLERWETSASIDALLAIPLVGDIMRSIKEASSVLASSPKAPIHISFRDIDTEAASRCKHTNGTENDSCLRFKDRVKHAGADSGDQEHTNVDHRKRGREDPSFSTSNKFLSSEEASSVQGRAPQSAKEKPFNFASADAGARILLSSSGVVGAKNVIEDSVDKYLLAPCTGDGIAESRWIEIELSEDVILESLETGNFEYYSSSARRVAILGASSYPPTQWNVLGVYNFADVRTLQRFQIEKRVVTRYLRVLFAGKQGHEYYCPISTIRAFGKNLIADWKDLFETPVGSAKGTEKASYESNASQNKNVIIEKGYKVLPTVSASVAMETPSNPPVPIEKCEGECPSEQGVRGQGSLDVDNTSGIPKSEEGTGLPQEKVLAEELSQDGERSASVENDSGSPIEEIVPHTGEELPEVSRVAKDTQSGMQNPQSTTGKEEAFNGESMSEDDQIVLEAVRADALSSVSGDDNIFRKVTRLIRLLELNQTLTNQYIDTHLSRFAKALSKAQLESLKAQQLTALTEQRMIRLMSATEGTIRELRSSALKRDVLLCVLIICVAFLLGTHWVLWTAVSGSRLHGGMEERNDDTMIDTQLSRMSVDERVPLSYIAGQGFREIGTSGRVQPHGRISIIDKDPIDEVGERTGRVRSKSSTELTTVTRRNGVSCHQQVDSD